MIKLGKSKYKRVIMKKYLIQFLMIALVAGIVACSSKKQEEGAESDEFKAAQEQSADVASSVEGVIYNIPPPAEIPWLLESTGAEFNESLINPHTKVDQYLTTFDVAAMNLGIYAADLGYLSSYEKTQGALNYLNSMKKLADFIGATTAYDVAMLERFEQNLGSRDSLYTIINQGIKDADQLLKDDDRSQIAALMTIGSFIEGLYVSTQLIEHYPETLLPEEARFTILTPLIRVVFEQRNSLNDLMRLANAVPQEGKIADVTNELGELKDIYASLNIEEKLAENKGNELLNDETLNKIGEKVAQIRNDIIE